MWGSRDFEQCVGYRRCSVGHAVACRWSTVGHRELQLEWNTSGQAAGMGKALPHGLYLSVFPYPFLLLPCVWATVVCKPAVKFCYHWTRINLKALEKSVGKLKTFLKVRKKSLMNDKEENRSQWDMIVEEKCSLLHNRVTEEIPQRKENKVLPCDCEWQLFHALWLDSCVFPPEKQVRKRRLTLFSEH